MYYKQYKLSSYGLCTPPLRGKISHHQDGFGVQFKTTEIFCFCSEIGRLTDIHLRRDMLKKVYANYWYIEKYESCLAMALLNNLKTVRYNQDN